MCGRYVSVQKVEYIEKKYNVQSEIDFLKPNYNVSAGDMAPVITCEHPDKLKAFCFGYSPNWGDKRRYVLNARAEGDHNREDDPKYLGPLDIISKPMWKSTIRKKRCLVIADAYVEGSTEKKLKEPFLVYMRNNIKAFAMAGLYENWVNRDTGEILGTFAIITTVANKLMQKIGHHRSPVILPPETHRNWLNQKSELKDILGYLKPFESFLLNAYPISPEISNPRNKLRPVIEPQGNPVFREYDIQLVKSIRLMGMGQSPARNRRLTEKETEMNSAERERIQQELESQMDHPDVVASLAD